MTTERAAEQELEPCPRCRGGAEVFPEEAAFGGYYVACVQPAFPIDECWLTLGEEYDRDGMPDHRFRTKEEAITAWNTRAHSTLAAENAELRKIMSMLVCHGCSNRIGWNETPTKYGDWTKCSSCRAARAALGESK